MATRILSASVNMRFYEGIDFTSMSYKDSLKFFENDERKCFTVHEEIIGGGKERSLVFFPDGSDEGDFSDTLYVWVEIE